MGKNFSYFAGLFILFSSLILTGCPKKVSPVEGTAGLSREKAETGRPSSRGEQPEGGEGRPLPPSPAEEKMPPLAKEEGPGGRSEGAVSAQDEGEARDRGEVQGKGEVQGERGEAALEDIFFDFDQWVIRPESRKLLEADAQWLAAHPQAKIQIEGHADERGTEEYNLALSERRAKSVMNFLVNLGVNPSRLSFISYGEEKPFCNEKAEDCYQKNRRAHFVAAPR